MYYFVIMSPESATLCSSLYFTDKVEALAYAKSISEFNPKIIEYDINEDNTMMYDNVIHFLKTY